MSFDSVTGLIIEYRYFILLPLSFVEGPIVAFIAGTLASLGYFNVYVLGIFFLVRDILVDLGCYYVGRYWGRSTLARKVLHKIGITDEELTKVRHLWQRHPGKTMFFSKLSYGLAAGFIIVAGIVETPLRIFIKYGILIAFMHYGVLLVLGFYFGNSFGSISKILENVSYAIAGFGVLFVAYYFFKKFITNRLKKMEKEEG